MMRSVKNILCFRADNFGDLLMSSPAIRAIKQTFDCKITVLTSSLGSKVVPLISEIDDCILFNLPWVKINETGNQQAVFNLIQTISSRNFDSCIIFNTFSQNPLPAALIAWLSKIPIRIGYCRENPYDLINKWLPDKEPYDEILHQVERDLKLAESMGTVVTDRAIQITIPEKSMMQVSKLLSSMPLYNNDYLIVHIGVSEEKRKYPLNKWVKTCQQLIDHYDYPLVFTGDRKDSAEIKLVTDELKGKVYDFSGQLSLPETAALIQRSKLLIAVNTGVIHLAAAVQTPVIVLYAQTNPQHKPWMTKFKALEYTVKEDFVSKNEIIRWIRKKLYKEQKKYPSADEICEAFVELSEEPVKTLD
ncbi:glycosyltransferase family 9 protein [Pedobacter montanisoli]|uniref:Glycosyltransferase family 9 protein n=1 Tax=Pedobacter montanisoli TaxID=2923277 RepID=A0ABS9ZYK9_9SPHI|nr:glycosyltransferase family 9 protein [Pedobacter montanisoli]MCJ0743402.1 glycosyltransferase family 9 protein [Pedobacter montanisoli]